MPAVRTSPNWTNVTDRQFLHPPMTFGMSIIWDPADAEALVFGGCADFGACPSNETWVYNGFGAWQNLTGVFPHAPSPRIFASMTWFPGAPGFALLFGGCDRAAGIVFGGCALNDTWTFNMIQGWVNITRQCTGACRAPPAGFGGAIVASLPPLAPQALLYGGYNSTSSAYSSSTFNWTPTGQWTELPTVLHPPGTYGSGMVFDPTRGAAILFGGDNGTLGIENTTWEFGFASATWTNVTGACASCAPMPGLFFPGMTYDNATASALLVGGMNVTDAPTNSSFSWVTARSGWSPLSEHPTPPPRFDPAVPSFSPGFVLLYGGDVRYLQVGPLNETYVFEVPPQLTASSRTPPVADVNASILLGDQVYGGYGGVNQCWVVDNTTTTCSFSNFTVSFATTGVHSLTPELEDSAGVFVAYPPQFERVVPAVMERPLHETGRLLSGQPVRFSANATSGLPPYHYDWEFGDGGTATGSNATHVFAAAGTYNVSVSALDAGGGVAAVNASVTLQPGITVSIAATPSPVDVRVPVDFSAVLGSHGSYTYLWNFSDGTTSNFSAPSHLFETPGTYNVTLNLTDASSVSVVRSVDVVVNPPLEVTVVLPLNNGTGLTAGQVLPFRSNVQGGTRPYSYLWLFGDGAEAATANATHVYAGGGFYSIVLWVNDSGGGSVFRSGSTPVDAAPSSSGSTPWGGWLLVGAGIAVVVLLSVVLWRIVGRRPPPTPAPVPPVDPVEAPARPPPGAL
jgi:PKD repeat protein